MRSKRKAFALKRASKPRSIKSTPATTAPEKLNDGVNQEDFARLENEGGSNAEIAVVEKPHSA
jgi:hypothetical protein